jgi:hypothetical protein
MRPLLLEVGDTYVQVAWVFKQAFRGRRRSRVAHRMLVGTSA